MHLFNISAIHRWLLFTLSFALFAHTAPPTCNFSSRVINDSTLQLTLHLPVPAGAHLYQDYMTFAVDNPAVTLSAWSSSAEARTRFDSKLKTTKKLFDADVTFSAQAHITSPLTAPARLHVTYYLSSNGGIVQDSFPLRFNNAADTQETFTCTTEKAENISEPLSTPVAQEQSATPSSYSDQLSSLITQTNKLWVRLVLVLFLGILMSLTPCIYPMIPITVGILHVQAGHSLIRNALVSLAYTLGIATTFALLGLAAATTGLLFGSFMTNPFVILCIVLLLAYLGFAMFGFYEMYVPSFLKSNSMHTGNGSLVSAFLFGVASGSVASPCLSPGLVLLLSIVTTLKSKLTGFLLLFMFGVGLSLPLLLIGTFSSSLTLLPRAGMWMLEIKKIFGFMLLGMCFYFLKPLLPEPLLLGMVALFLAVAGIFYLYSETKTASGRWRSVAGFLGVLLLAAACVVATQAYKAHLIHYDCVHCSDGRMDYATALNIARSCNKKLFIDIGASFCSICNAIDKKVLAHAAVQQALTDFCVVKIDGANDPDNVFQQLQEAYGIVGVPTFLLLDAHSGALIKRWGSELYGVDPKAFAQELAQLAKT